MNHQRTTEADTAAVRHLLERSCEAWNRGDGAAYGELFTDDATDVTFVGTVYQGGEEIGRAHQALFDSFLKGTRLAMEILDIRFYGADTAVVVSRGDVHKGRPGKLGKVQTYTLVRGEDGRWRIAAVQKTKRQRLMEAVSFKFQPATKPR
ncbi:SgcJ/EcaC family oxidoreductase [Nonomuraea sp. 3-1Str]|uniref:SgcJ/EcaC family oxidoreductase n=1 Tax=Nonomuraea sp. 3-1Str TaxID=2929801 RepID=UPI002858124A|nr:SgcJ/EcaC family oxidoreductase [Nonomuraea sp. 3-1Str]MDR8409879.1 SgcJ/EcaC family oxidoreductase [Nonomuraea sp. 3-1Str]